MITTLVTLDGERFYEALLNPDERWNGYVCPHFTLRTVRQIAADSQAEALRDGHESHTIHVIDGATNNKSSPLAVVVHVRWTSLTDEPTEASTIEHPDRAGLYCIGGWEWTWSIADDAPTIDCPDSSG